MATVTNIDAVLTAHTGKFDAGMARARKGIEGLTAAEKQFNREQERLNRERDARYKRWGGRILGIAAAYLSLRTVVHGFSESSDRLDKLAKIGDSLGATTQEMQALGRTMELAGVESEGMNKALKFMQVQLGKTQTGTEAMQESASRVFRDIGLDIDNLLGQSVSDQFATVAEALLAMESNEQRLAVGAQIFGRNILDIMPALEDARENLKQSTEFAERFGIALSRQDVGAVERMNDTWSDVWRVIQGVTDRLTVGLAPALIVVAEQLLGVFNVSNAAGGSLDKITGRAGEFTALAAGVNFVANTVRVLAGAFDIVAGAVNLVLGGITRMVAFFTDDARLDAVGLQMVDDWMRLTERGLSSIDEVFSGRATEAFKTRLAEVGKEMEEIKKKTMRDFVELGDAAGGGGGRIGAAGFAQRGSVEAARLINQSRLQTSGILKELVEGMKKALSEQTMKLAAEAGMTNRLLGDANTHLSRLSDLADDDLGDSI